MAILAFLIKKVLRATTTCILCTAQLPIVVRTRNVLYFFSFFFRATTASTLSTSQAPKLVRTRRVLRLFTSKFVSRHNSVHFFDISTSKNGLRIVCFTRFFQNVLRATTACNFPFFLWPPTSAPASLASLPFEPLSHKTLEKHTVSRLSHLFARPASAFFSISHLLPSDFLYVRVSF